MYTINQVRGLLNSQSPFLEYPGVRRPYIYVGSCPCCGDERYILKCCRSIWCPICNLKLAGKTYHQMQYINSEIPKKYIRQFVTLTFRNTALITKHFFRQYRNIFVKKFLRKKPFKKTVIGGFYSFDWTINQWYRDHTFNIHIHLLWFSRSFYHPDFLSRKWSEASGDSQIVDIRLVKNIDKALYEVQKYIQASKSILACEEKRRTELINAVQGIRRFSKFGQAYKVKIPKTKATCDQCNEFYIYEREPLHTEQFSVPEYPKVEYQYPLAVNF